MDDALIRSLIAALAASDLTELEYSRDGETLRLTRRIAGAPAEAAPPPPSRTATLPPIPTPSQTPTLAGASRDLLSPLYGVVHLRPAPDAPPFATVGQSLRAGQTLCVIEAMKVFNEVRAERDGTLLAVLVETGQEVESGQPLFRLG